MFYKCSVIVLFVILSLQKQKVNTYNVALVEYFVDHQVFNSLSPLNLGNRNAKNYDEIVKNIKDLHKELDLVVFPETTLVSNPLNNSEGKNGMTFVPEPNENIIPCSSSSEDYANFFKILSCTAKKYRTYLVINLKEKAVSEEDLCESGKLNFYNTDVVFDRNGKVIARYRKYNTYLESDTNKPSKLELTTFETDFGKKFGIFTCFDILFQYPSIELVRNDVKNIIYPTFWIPELPFLNSIQIQQMWAQENDVTFLASGAAFPSTGSGSLGIFMGNKGPLVKEVSPKTNNFYLYKNVPEKEEFSASCNMDIDDKKAEEMDQYKLYQEDLSKYSYKKLNTAEKSLNIEEKICQNQGNETFCCSFHIETELKNEFKTKNSVYSYFLVARSGTRTFGGRYVAGIDVCGLIACSGSTFDKCGYRYPSYKTISWPIKFKTIEITATSQNSDKKMYFPNSLMADFSPISPYCTSWKKEVNSKKTSAKTIFKTLTPLKKLLTFAIFGRNYNLDMNSN